MSNDPDSFNPYQPSIEALPSDDTPVDQRFVSGQVRELARWQMFFAVLALIGALIFFGMMVLGAVMDGDPATLIAGLICPTLSVLLFYAIPAIQLWKAATVANRYANTGSSAELSEFASSQLAFWRAVGILAAIVLVLFALMMILALFWSTTQFVGISY